MVFDPFYLVILLMLGFLLALRGWNAGRRWAAFFLLVPAFYVLAENTVLSGVAAGWASLALIGLGWYILRRIP